MLPKKLFCFGFGYSAQHLAARLKGTAISVSGTTTTPEKASDTIHLFNRDTPLVKPAAVFKDVTHLLISIPPDDKGDAVLSMHAKDIQRIPTLEWIGYLSTTGVYGDMKCAWVDEETPPVPQTPRSIARYEIEKKWQRFDLPAHIFRLSGIYGPGRSALDAVRQGRAQRINKMNHIFNRIHVADIAQTLQASMMKPKPGSLYNLADDMPAPNEEVIDYACQLLGHPSLPLIPYEQAELSPMAREFYAECKRIRNHKIKQELGVKLLYPNYKKGLDAIIAAD